MLLVYAVLSRVLCMTGTLLDELHPSPLCGFITIYKFKFFLVLNLSVHVHACACARAHVKVRGQLPGANSLFTVTPGSGNRTAVTRLVWQGPFPAEPSCWPNHADFICGANSLSTLTIQ